MPCSADPDKYRCRSVCNTIMACCGKRCLGKCSDCQTMNSDPTGEGIIPRIRHSDHHCEKPLQCGHNCAGKCSDDHDCADDPCEKECRQRCEHRSCQLTCSAPCPPCFQPCTWTCAHIGTTCPVICGAVSQILLVIRCSHLTPYFSPVLDCRAMNVAPKLYHVDTDVRRVSRLKPFVPQAAHTIR